jgi:glycosyltransferase involved in cell wall biosynthesis
MRVNIKDLPKAPPGKQHWPWILTSEAAETIVTSELPSITIVTPSFNQGSYIEETIRSVLLQCYPNIQYIIIDGGSTDETVEIIRKYEKWIDYWISEKDSGQSNAINKGLQLANGEIYNWVNSDDVLAEGALIKVGNAFKNKGQLLCVRGTIEFFSSARRYFSKSLYSNNDAENIGFAPTRILQPATFFKRSLLEQSQVGPYNESSQYVFDLEWMIRFLMRYGHTRMFQIPDVLCHFRLHDHSKTVAMTERFEMETDSFFYSLALKIRDENKIKFFEKYCALNRTLILQVPPEIGLDFLKRVLNYFFLFCGEVKYATGQRDMAHKYFLHVNLSKLKMKDGVHMIWLLIKNRLVPWKLFGRN